VQPMALQPTTSGESASVLVRKCAAATRPDYDGSARQRRAALHGGVLQHGSSGEGGGSAPVIGTLAQRRSGRGITGGRTATTSHRVDDAATAAELNNANHRLAAHGDNGVRCG
jgi:hypothetical protein